MNDFEKSYPATASFDENFLYIKRRLLELLENKGSHIRAESAVSDLLDLATGKFILFDLKDIHFTKKNALKILA